MLVEQEDVIGNKTFNFGFLLVKCSITQFLLYEKRHKNDKYRVNPLFTHISDADRFSFH